MLNKIRYLNLAIKSIEDLKDIFENLKISTQTKDENFVASQFSLIINKCIDCIDHFHQSIIYGEYIYISYENKLDNIIEELKKGNININNSSKILTELSSKSELFRAFKENYNIDKYLLKVLDDFKDFITFVNRKADKTDNHNIIEIDNHIIHSFKQNEEIELVIEMESALQILETNSLPYLVSVFKINIALAELDLTFKCDKPYLTSLITIRSIFKNSIEDHIDKQPLLYLLYSKCNFLIKKVLLRLSESRIRINIRDDYRDLKIPELNKDLGCFEVFDTLTQERYQNETNFLIDSQKYSEIMSLISEKNDAKLIFTNLHFLTKYYCKNAGPSMPKAYENNCNLLSQWKSIYVKNTDYPQFDQIAISSFKLLIKKNCIKIRSKELQLEIENSSSNFEAIKVKYYLLLDSYNNINEDKTEIEDYYEHKLFIMAIIPLLQLLIINSKEKELEERFSFIMEILDKCDYAVIRYQKNILWVKTENYMPLFLPYNECIKEIQTHFGNVKWDVFLDSSYLLPINLKSDEDYLYSIKELINSLRSKFTFRLANSISQRVEDKNEILKIDLQNKFDTKVKDSQIGAVQIIALYASFITFILGTISVVPNFTRSSQDALLFLLIFFIGLLTFALTLNGLFDSEPGFRFRQKIENVSGYSYNKFAMVFWINIVVIILATVSILTINFSPTVSEKKSQVFAVPKDSLSNNKMDSIGKSKPIISKPDIDSSKNTDNTTIKK